MSVTQFVKAALIGTDGEYVVLSPVVEGVDGASRTIFATEVGEEIKIEDDQTVFTSVKNTITIIATVLDADITKINSWITNDVSVGFSGYTIGGLGYAPALTSDDSSPNFQLELRQNSVDTGNIVTNRGDAFQISAIQRVSEIKHTWRIVLTQVCLQGKSATSGVRYGAQPSDNLFETTVSKNFTTMGTGTTLPMYANNSGSLTYSPTGDGFKIDRAASGSNSTISHLFFPFPNTRINFSATGAQTASFNSATASVYIYSLDSAGSTTLMNSTSLSTGSTSFSNTFTLPTNTAFLQLRIDGSGTTASQSIEFTDIRLRPNV